MAFLEGLLIIFSKDLSWNIALFSWKPTHEKMWNFSWNHEKRPLELTTYSLLSLSALQHIPEESRGSLLNTKGNLKQFHRSENCVLAPVLGGFHLQ